MMFPGQIILGAGLDATMVAVARLFAGLGSAVEELKTTAVFPINAPSATEQLTCAVMVITPLAPGAIEPIVTLTEFPVPPQVPRVVAQLSGIRLIGSVSVTVTSEAGPGPALVTSIVSVIAVPVTAGLGVATIARLRSAEPLTAAALSTTVQCEKAEVLPVKSVAVAVTVWPGGVKNGSVILKGRLPPPFVFWLMNPMRFCPSPEPEASQDWLEKNSILIG